MTNEERAKALPKPKQDALREVVRRLDDHQTSLMKSTTLSELFDSRAALMAAIITALEAR